MKKLLLNILLIIVSSIFVQAQQPKIPEKIDFQAIARNDNGEPLADQIITVRMTIIEGPLPGMEVYQEEHKTQTDDFGLFMLPIGGGTPLIDSIQAVDWSGGPHFVRIEVDKEGGSDYLDMGTMELMTVPYAFYAKHVENADDADADPQNELQQLSVGQNNALTISQGNTVQLPKTSPWDEQGLSVYLNSPKKVGIGLNSVPHPVTIYRDGFATMGFLTDGTEIGQSSGLVVGFRKTGFNAEFWNHEKGSIRLGTNNELRLLINQFGRVGIGTGAPAEKLEVSSGDDNVGIRIRSGEAKNARLTLMEKHPDNYGFSWEYDGSEKKVFLRSHGFRNDSDEEVISVYSDKLIELGTESVLIHGKDNESTILSIDHEDNASSLHLGTKNGYPILDFYAKPLLIKAENRTALAIDDDSAYVGIGTSNPKEELDVKGDVRISKDLKVEDDTELVGSLKVGGGSSFNKIIEYTGTTASGLGNHSKDFSYPAGYTQSNTRVLCLQIKLDTGNWWGIGGGYTGYEGATSVSRDNSVRKINACLYDDYIRIWYPAREAYQGQPFRILLLRMGN